MVDLRSTPRLCARAWLLGTIAALLTTATSRAATIHDYQAVQHGTLGPYYWWYAGPSISEQYVANAANTGVAAWQMATSSNGQYGFYGSNLYSNHLSQAASQGWRFEADARYQLPTGNIARGQNFGLQVSMNGRIYLMTLSNTATGRLVAGLWGNAGIQSYELTTTATATQQFHNFAFVGSPSTGTVALQFDGAFVANFPVFVASHTDSVEWGNFGQQPGTMQYSKVRFSTGPFVTILPGDFNRDGTVNTGDYTVWRDTLGSRSNLLADVSGNGVVDQADLAIWRSRYGSTAPALLSSSVAIPEPRAGLLLSCCVALTVAVRRHRRGT